LADDAMVVAADAATTTINFAGATRTAKAKAVAKAEGVANDRLFTAFAAAADVRTTNAGALQRLKCQ